jgi:hypothetical protein
MTALIKMGKQSKEVSKAKAVTDRVGKENRAKEDRKVKNF